MASGPLDAALHDEVAACANPELAARVLADLDDASARAGLGELGDLAVARPRFAERLVRLVAASRSIGNWLVAHPEEVAALADDSRFEEPREPAALRADALAAAGQAGGGDPEGTAGAAEPATERAWEALRRFKRREFVRVAARDLVGVEASVEQVGAELAVLADACLEAALALATAGGPPVRIALLGMGKLGGLELNYVSDIDILAVHEPVPGGDPDEATEVAARAVRAVVRGLGAPSAEGTAYRVDLNLRPEGRDGPLSRTLASYEAYWDRWAEPWEFQSLIKLRHSAGDAELAERFHAAAAARTWPERLGDGAIEAIRSMKARVEASVGEARQRRGAGDAPGASLASRHVKLGPGGIRDIEWAVQLLQLVHARQDPGLRSPNTLVALAALAAADLVGDADADQLAAAYRFLRTVEHRLQLIDERRTHTIPAGHTEQAWLARVLGYPGLEEFQADRQRTAHIVRRLHEKLFYRPLLEVFGAVPPLAPAQAHDRLVGLGFAAPGRAVAHLEALTAGLSRSAALMRAVLPVMLPWIAAAPDPDGGLLALRVLADRLADRPSWLQLLRENPVGAERLCTVLGTSPVLGELLTHHPELVDAFADESALLQARPAAELRAEAEALVARHADDAAAWDALRRLKRRELVRSAVRDLLVGDEQGLSAQPSNSGAELTAVAEACLDAGLRIAGRDADAQPLPRIALIGMGKLGGEELHYISDLDLMVVHEPAPGTGAEDASSAAARVVRALVRGLGTATREGVCFKVDLDLRPEGRDGPVSRSLAAYEAYWDRWAQPWEFQALVKARPVGGDADLGARFMAAAGERTYPLSLSDDTVGALRKMKARVETERLPRGADPRLHLKLGPGGLADVEWTVQLLQLRHGGADPSVRLPGTRAALTRLAEKGALDARDAAWLLDAYDLCTRLRNIAYLVTGRPREELPTDPAVLGRIAKALGLGGDRQELMDTYRRATRRARQVVERHFWGGKL
jgi:glutamate-ammonia-ligase adenylyltransferase